MKKVIIFFLFTVVFATSCGDDFSTDTDTPCGYYNGHRLYKGPEGGCYYINLNNNKTYVDRNLCNC